MDAALDHGIQCAENTGVNLEEGKADADGGYDFAADASVFHGIGLFIQGVQFFLEFVRHFAGCRSRCSGGGALFF